MISVFRNFAPIAITLVEWLWMKERKPSAGVLFSMALLIMGAVIAALNDWAFTVEGYLWILTNVFANVVSCSSASAAAATRGISPPVFPLA